MSALLHAAAFDAAYGEVAVVRAVSFTLAPGEIVALLGRNGMGKTTLIRGIVGLAPVRRGTLTLDGTDVTAAPPEAIAHMGVGYVPAERGIFGSLSVRENLIMCARTGDEAAGVDRALAGLHPIARRVDEFAQRQLGRELMTAHALDRARARLPDRMNNGGVRPRADNGPAWTLERVLELFPRLAERIEHGGQKLSGGEQQMLSIGRALMTNPRLLLVDEATEGLAPLVARDIWRTLAEICNSGVAALIVDRDVRRLAGICGRAIVLFKGEIVFDGAPDTLLGDEALVQRYIGL